MNNHSIEERDGTKRIHARNPLLFDYTLCGMLLYDATEWPDAENTSKEIKCPDCMTMIRECTDMGNEMLSDRVKKKKAKIKKKADDEKYEKILELSEAYKDERKINIAGHMISMNNLAIYLDFINGGISRDANINNYENKRCELHQNLFQEAGEDRLSGRESDFCRALDYIICEALCCPRCKRSANREGLCPTCHRHIGFKQIRINLNRLSKEYATKPYTGGAR